MGISTEKSGHAFLGKSVDQSADSLNKSITGSAKTQPGGPSFGSMPQSWAADGSWDREWWPIGDGHRFESIIKLIRMIPPRMYRAACSPSSKAAQNRWFCMVTATTQSAVQTRSPMKPSRKSSCCLAAGEASIQEGYGNPNPPPLLNKYVLQPRAHY